MQINIASTSNQTALKHNKPFTLPELTKVIQRSHNTIVDPDEIHYKFLKHEPKKISGQSFIQFQ